MHPSSFSLPRSYPASSPEDDGTSKQPKSSLGTSKLIGGHSFSLSSLDITTTLSSLGGSLIGISSWFC